MDTRGKLVCLVQGGFQDQLDHRVRWVYLVHLVYKDQWVPRGVRGKVEIQVFKVPKDPWAIWALQEDQVNQGTRACTEWWATRDKREVQGKEVRRESKVKGESKVQPGAMARLVQQD